MIMVPSDIFIKVDQDFSANDAQQVKEILTSTYHDLCNVGAIVQCLRSVVFLANGELDKVKAMCLPYLQYDPRDLIMEAEEAAGSPGHWFGIRFHEMEGFSREMPENEVSEEEEDGNLPF